MHLSGILVRTDPQRMEACRHELEALPGVEVHHDDPQTGRMIAVLESDSLKDQEDGLRRIQALPTVRLAALVEYQVDPDGDPTEASATDLRRSANPPAEPTSEEREP